MFKNYHAQFVLGAGANDVFLRLGFCPDVVRLTEFETGLAMIWSRAMGNDSSITFDADWTATVNTGEGVKLVYFEDAPDNISSDPTTVEAGEWYLANGIQLTSDCGVLTNGGELLVEAWESPVHMIRAVHDGGDAVNTYFQDASIDFLEAGVSSNGKYIVFNVTNDNYAYIGKITKPSGQTKYCRCYTYEDASLDTATAAADFDDDDILIIMPADNAQYPLSDVGLMT